MDINGGTGLPGKLVGFECVGFQFAWILVRPSAMGNVRHESMRPIQVVSKTAC